MLVLDGCVDTVSTALAQEAKRCRDIEEEEEEERERKKVLD